MLISTDMVAGVVVLYHPDEKVWQNINSYRSQIAKLYAIDNSEDYNNSLVKLLQSTPGIEYISSNGNLGIAQALNTGALRAIEEGYHWLLTMDQDTSIPDNMVSLFQDFAMKNNQNSIGIISPNHSKERTKSSGFIEVPYTMTSGNLLNLKAYKIVGGFRDDLFIDHVDHEYCLRLNKHGYKVYQNNETIIDHSLGTPILKRLLFWKISTTYHSPARLYYIIRNGLFVRKLYPKSRPFKTLVSNLIFREFVKSLLFYNEPMASLKAMWMGYKDYCHRVTGKLDRI